jgi:hypothetical protein
MNKFYIVFLLVFVCGRFSVFAEGDTIRLNPDGKVKKQYYQQPLLLKSNPLAMLWGPIPFTAEYRLVAEITTGRTRSVQFGISYLDKSPLWSMYEKASNTPSYYELKVKGWRIQAAYRLYLISRKRYAPFGFYISPSISYSDAHISIGLERYYREVYFDFRHFNSTMQIGVQVGRNSNITMDIFAGIGYKSNIVYYHATDSYIIKYNTKDFGTFYNNHLKLVFGINFGYALY